MKSDVDLKKDVVAELAWDPAINETNIGVAARNGVVTLSGHIDTYAEKTAIQKAVQRVAGVQALALELDVKLDPSHRRNDTEIAAAAEQAFLWHALIPEEKLQVTVEKGWVTLKGEVDWEYQRMNAEKAVRNLTGVVGVSNNIALKPATASGDISSRIRAALQRQAEDESRRIEVSVKGATVTLRGTVHSWAERSAAYSAAFAAPGVSSVVNEIRIAA